MKNRQTRLAVGLAVASAVLVLVGTAAALSTEIRLSRSEGSIWALISFVIPIAAFSAVGGVIAVRRPGNPIGWLLAAIGLLFAIVVASAGISVWALETGSLPRAAAEWISVAPNAWVIALGLIGIQLPLRVPDGTLPSPRWRWFSRLSILLIAVSVVGMAVQPGEVEGVPGTANPLGVESLAWLPAVFFGVLLCFVVALVALVLRYLGADSRERVQLRWIAFGGVLFFVVYFVTLLLVEALGEGTAAADVLISISQAAFAALPISIGYAMLRHRLYDIDVVINRALVYGGLTLTLGAAYLGLVLVAGLAVGRSSDLAIAGSTLAVAALFRPARSRIQALVDRRFFRRRYDAALTLASFSGRLRDEIDLEHLGDDLRGVVQETVQPAHVSLWLRSHS
ncbi:MAG: hypothetical protein H0V26_08950 [Solirubrobacterales bacterium]|nr:hypothetical protein [Solirubrobacterales bacterium]